MVAAWRGVAILLLGEGRMNSENEIKQGLLAVCKVKGWDSDINIVGFHALCDELKALGADDEREACAQLIESLFILDDAVSEFIAKAIRARGNS